MRVCIVTADASRARLFTLDSPGDAESEELVEHRDLVNPARRQTAAQLFSDSPGSTRTGGLQYGFDDHRAAHLHEMDVDFARDIIVELTDLLRTTPSQRLILCASPRMLGELRRLHRDIDWNSIQIDEVPRDLVRLSPSGLRDQLASYQLLPPRPRRGRA